MTVFQSSKKRNEKQTLPDPEIRETAPATFVHYKRVQFLPCIDRNVGCVWD